MADFPSKKPDHDKSTVEFNDMCDDVIEMILRHLQLEDLVNISDTSTRLRAIAGPVFSRNHAHRLLCIEVFHYSLIIDSYRDILRKRIPYYRPCDPIVRISDAKIWFKLMRNFGGSVKRIHIQEAETLSQESSIPQAMENLSKYIFEYCGDSLETLDVEIFKFLTFNKPLTRLEEFCARTHRRNILEILEFMPNVRSVRLDTIPKTIAKFYWKLERIELKLEKYSDVETFISFARLNPQIKHLKLDCGYKCHHRALFSTIADIFTQLKTLKLNELAIDRIRFKTVEKLSVHTFYWRDNIHFDNLKKVTLRVFRDYDGLCLMKFARQNRRLKILKCDLHETFLQDGYIPSLLKELSELEEFIVYSFSDFDVNYFKKLLGGEWEQFKKDKGPNYCLPFHNFRKRI